jgi:hypothetical protein
MSCSESCADFEVTQEKHSYEIRPRRDNRSVDPISDVLSFGRLWYGEPNANQRCNRIRKVYSRSHHAAIRVYDAAGNVIETHEHAGDFREFELRTTRA